MLMECNIRREWNGVFFSFGLVLPRRNWRGWSVSSLFCSKCAPLFVSKEEEEWNVLGEWKGVS
jgi:hypothetical protein